MNLTNDSVLVIIFSRICESMGLSHFDLSELEVKRMDVQSQLMANSQTLGKEISCLSLSASNRDDKFVTPPSSPCSPISPPLSASSIESDSAGESSGSSSSFGDNSGVCMKCI